MSWEIWTSSAGLCLLAIALLAAVPAVGQAPEAATFLDSVLRTADADQRRPL